MYLPGASAHVHARQLAEVDREAVGTVSDGTEHFAGVESREERVRVHYRPENAQQCTV
jgi:hypothetical protein